MTTDAGTVQRVAGTSALRVPPIMFGAWAIGGWWWGGTDDFKAIEAIHKAEDIGMNCFDTAPQYGFGHSEEVLGKALKGKRPNAIIATKCGLRHDRTDGEHFFDTRDNNNRKISVYKVSKKDSVIEECEQSLKRLQTDYIDIYQIHWPDSTTPFSETMEALVRLYEQGKIRAIGVSNFTRPMIEECLRHGPVHTIQPLYNPLARDIEHEILPLCVDKEIGILAYSPLEHGLLSGKVTMDRTFPEGDERKNLKWFQPEQRKKVLNVLERIEPIAREHNATIAQIILAWVISRTGITAAIAGARDSKQVEENWHAVTINLSDEEARVITGEFESIT